jgi:Tfp pilus assembly protein PilF
MKTRMCRAGGPILVAAFTSTVTLLVCNCAAQSTSPQQPRTAGTTATALTPEQKEAQKHYRIALEALKNNDFSTAADELIAASKLAPKNALIWYNLAVVESKKGDSASALQHLHKAQSLGLPKSVQDDAD